MSLSISVALFFAVIILYSLIIDIFTILFRMSGMTEEKSRFQVISLLTNSGYTTKESELVVDKLKRRKLARTIMLFGYIFSVTIITAFVNVVMNLPKVFQEDFWKVIIVIAIIFVVLIVAKRIPRVKEKFDNIIEKMGRKILYHGNINMVSVVDQYAKGVVAGVNIVKVPEEMKDKTMDQVDMMAAYKIKIILIQRGGEVLDEQNTNIKRGDRLVVFGKLADIMAAFEVPDEDDTLIRKKRSIKN